MIGVFGLFSYGYFESSGYAGDQFNYGLLVVVNRERWWVGGQPGWLVPMVGRRLGLLLNLVMPCSLCSFAGFEILVCLSCSFVELLCLDLGLGLGLGLVRFGLENARKSGFVFFSVFVEDEPVLNSCSFWILIMFFSFLFC